MKKSLLIASLAVTSEIVFGMFPNNPNGNFGNNGNKRSFSQISEINGEEQQSRRIRISSREGIPIWSENGLDLLALTAMTVEQMSAQQQLYMQQFQVQLHQRIQQLHMQQFQVQLRQRIQQLHMQQFRDQQQQQVQPFQSQPFQVRQLHMQQFRDQQQQQPRQRNEKQEQKNMRVALRKGNIEEVKKLVDEGVKISRNAVNVAAREGHIDIIKYLLENGANIEFKDYVGRTSLFLAAEKGNKDIVKYLLGKGANIEAKNRWGETPLIISAKIGHWDIVKYLVGKGANIEAKSKWGETPLFLAAEKGNKDIVKYLVGKGANKNCAKSGITALMRAALKGHKNVVELLLKQGYESDLISLIVASKNKIPMSKDALLNVYSRVMEYFPADVNAKDSNGDTALIHALLFSYRLVSNIHEGTNGYDLVKIRYDIVKMLLDHGADPNVKNDRGWTPLIYAARLRSENTARLLIERKADLNKAISILEGDEGEKGLIEFLNSLVTKE